MAYQAAFFDLDGTLTDSGPGIMNCAQMALAHYGISVASRDDLRVFVGPPLRESLLRFGIPQASIEEAIAVFRKRYQTTGIWENFPYPGIDRMLASLQEKGIQLYVATSKPEAMAVKVLDRFGLSGFFWEICGDTMDGRRGTKSAVIAYLLEKCQGIGPVAMVGDTVFDVVGAAAHGIPTIGVSWGYGDRDAMLASGAVAVADTPEELEALLT